MANFLSLGPTYFMPPLYTRATTQNCSDQKIERTCAPRQKYMRHKLIGQIFHLKRRIKPTVVYCIRKQIQEALTIEQISVLLSARQQTNCKISISGQQDSVDTRSVTLYQRRYTSNLSSNYQELVHHCGMLSEQLLSQDSIILYVVFCRCCAEICCIWISQVVFHAIKLAPFSMTNKICYAEHYLFVFLLLVMPKHVQYE